MGDIFGAPLAIEGIMAFFLETTFIAVMFFGWDRVGKRISPYIELAGSCRGQSLRALILVANAWMQDPVGMQFNPRNSTQRNDGLLGGTAVPPLLSTNFSMPYRRDMSLQGYSSSA